MTKEYLYGKDVGVPELPRYVVMRRIELLNDNLRELLEVAAMERDTKRCNAIIKAIKFWEELDET